MVERERERERERESKRVRTVRETQIAIHLQIYTRWTYIFRDPWFFVLISRETYTGMSYNHPSPQKTTNTYCLPLILLTADWLLSVYSANFSVRGWKLLSLYIFRMPTHTSYVIYVVVPFSFAYLKTQLHILFLNPQTVLLKVNIQE